MIDEIFDEWVEVFLMGDFYRFKYGEYRYRRNIEGVVEWWEGVEDEDCVYIRVGIEVGFDVGEVVLCRYEYCLI